MWAYGPEDSGQPKIWQPLRERDEVEKMTWYIYTVCQHSGSQFSNYSYAFKGEDLRREKRISVNFYRTLGHNFTENELLFKDTLIQSEAMWAPIYPGKGKLPLQISCKSSYKQPALANLF